MFTYDVVSESVRNPHELAAELTRRSQEGWEVVQITYDGASWFHAFIRHTGNVSVAPYPGMHREPAGGTPARNPPANQPTSANQSTSAPAAAQNIPANWYKDPSGRFELRYWNGTAWTEHVSTGGSQSVDPPQP